jgi:steroid 5-alpha reductase family enzyme
MLQGILLLFVALPICIANASPMTQLNIFDLVGLCVWLFGFYFEVVGDRQLKNFIADPSNKGKVCTVGLWQYTRHPNYFGEVCLWWGIWSFAVASSFPIEIFDVIVSSAILALIGPLTITFLILKVSGVPMTERQMMNRPGFAVYAAQTSMFIPWFTKK